ncbi:MAG: patatin-like phospholipase family protein [Candidatus Omnitrophota bacterium]
MENPLFLDKSLIFEHIPLFADLDAREKELVYSAMEVVQYRPSEIIYSQGDSPDAFYCILTGRVQIYAQRDGAEETLEHIYRGKYFGFISLLTGEPHSVSARAVNDTAIVRISREKFEKILRQIPRLAIDLSQMLSRRLKRKDLHHKSIFESTIVSIYGDPLIAGDAALYALNLAVSLRKETQKKVILVDLQHEDSPIRRVLGISASSCYLAWEQFFNSADVFRNIVRTDTGIEVLGVCGHKGASDVAPLIALLTTLVNDYHYCLLHVPPDFGPQAFKVLAQSDAVHLLTAPDVDSVRRLSRLFEMSGLLDKAMPRKKLRLLVVEEQESHGRGRKLSICQEESLFRLPVFATLPPQSEDDPFLVSFNPLTPYARCVRRISRQLGEVLVGLALGSGSAMGLAHIGVLETLEEEGVAIDMVCGSSIGALIGALWAAGYSAGEIHTIILRNNKKRYLLGPDDLTFPLRGLIRGRHVKSFLKRYLGKKTFCDLKMPFRTVACDCRTMKRVVFESGRLVDAVMASISIPGVFAPYSLGGKYYMDGGIVDPLPTDVLVNAGARKIIAVNVLPSPDEIARTYELSVQKRVSPDFLKQGVLRYPWYYFRHKLQEWMDPNIFGVIVSTIQSMQYLMAEMRCLNPFDVCLHPDMTGVCWSDFEHAEDLISRGRKEAVDHLPQIRNLISHKE